MKAYIQHLLADIRAAHKRDSSVSAGEAASESENLEMHFEDIERWLSGHASKPLHDHCGLSKNDFPPENQLSDAELILLTDAFTEMLESWNISVSLPEQLPLRMRYVLIIGLLDRKISPIRTGSFVYDFCTGYAPGCELAQYCNCLKYWDMGNDPESPVTY
ncbi:MAG: hypothetical protein JJU35_07885 [Balneolales bacterium]|nr:hypothetical protein [Balneolales bacterium]